LSKDYKLYHRYLSEQRSKETNTTEITYSEGSGSGAMPIDSTNPKTEAPINPVYVVTEMTAIEVEETFKAKYPLQYLQARRKFDKKLKKLLEANEEAVLGL